MMLIEALRANAFKPTTVTRPDWPPGHRLTVFAIEHEGEMYVDDFCSYDFNGSGLAYSGHLHRVAPGYFDTWTLCAPEATP